MIDISNKLMQLNTAKQNLKNELIEKGVLLDNTPFTDYYLIVRNMQTVALVLEFDDLSLFFNKGIRYNDSVISKIDTSIATIMNSMFKEFTTLTTITLNTDSCVFMQYMFYGCSALVTVNLSSTANVADFAFAFFGTALQTISLDTANAQSLEQCFTNCSALTNVTLTTLANCINFKGIFYNCTSLAISGIDVSAAEDVRQMYYGCSSLTAIQEFTPTLATSTSGVFQNCTNLTDIPYAIYMNTVTDINNMFNGCSSLTSIVLMNCFNIETANGAFAGCTSLTELQLNAIHCNLSVTDCALQEVALNVLFDTLDSVSVPTIINITGTPGAATCDKTIAELKGWTVVS